MDVPSLLWSVSGLTRASTAVLSHTGPAPGAVTAAQALPPDWGRVPPLALFSASSSDIVVGSRVTVMSAPIRVSQNGETFSLTDTAEAPLGWLLFVQVVPPSLAAGFAARAFAASASREVEASTSSWLQSSLLISSSVRGGATAACRDADASWT